MRAPAAPTPAASDEASDEISDGRVLRRARNRDAVIDALVALINEGNLNPSAKEIAARAGVSHRSVFRYFDDMRDLAETAIRREFLVAAKLAALPSGDGRSLEERIDVLVDTRLVFYQTVHYPAIVAQQQARRYPRITEETAALTEILRRDLGVYFRPELGEIDDTGRAVVDAILTITSFDSWDLAHRVYHYDDTAIRASWTTSLGVLLGNAAAR